MPAGLAASAPLACQTGRNVCVWPIAAISDAAIKPTSANAPRRPAGLIVYIPHSGRIETAVHVQDFTADTRCQVGAKEGTSIADLFDSHIPAQWSLRFVGCQHLAEVLYTGGCKGTNGACRHCVDPSTVRTKTTRQIAHTCLQASLGHTHDVVVRHSSLCAQVGQSQKTTVTALHH